MGESRAVDPETRTKFEEAGFETFEPPEGPGLLARISHQSWDKERVAGFGGERGRWIESWGALARVL